MAPSVYLETSIISYLVAHPSRDIVAATFAHALIAQGALPERAAADALHVAIATVQGIEYLLTWNCQHIANARLRVHIERACRERGLAPPVLCTPEELMGDME